MWGSRVARSGLTLNEPRPQEVDDQSDRVNRYLNFLVDALMLGLIAFVMHRTATSSTQVGLRFDSWKRDAVVGVFAATLLIAAQGLMLRRLPLDPRHAFTSRVRKGSPVLWVFIFAGGAFSEELWVALCLVVLREATHSVILPVVATLVVFAAMHYSYGLWGAMAAGAKETVSALLFLHFGSLVVTFSYHFIGNLGSLYWNRYSRHVNRMKPGGG